MLLLKFVPVFLFFANCSCFDLFGLDLDSFISLSSDALIRELEDNLSDSTCKDHLIILLEEAAERKEWALRMLDATAKPQTGILSGNIMHIGNYDECLNVTQIYENRTKIQGKYCTLLWGEQSPKQGPKQLVESGPILNIADYDLLWYRTSYGVCIPKSCHKKQMEEIFNIFEEQMSLELSVKYNEDNCFALDKHYRNPWQDVGALGVMAIIAAIVSLSTIMDILREFEYLDFSVLSSFSLYKNIRKLFDTRSKETYYVRAVDGIKVMTMMWVVLAHGFLVRFSFPNVNALDAIAQAKGHTANVFIISATFAADSFFTISGFLVVFTFLHNLEAGNKISVIKFYLHRFVRLTPALAMAIFIYYSIFVELGDGPFWNVVQTYIQEPCQKNWFWSLFYVQNYFVQDVHCIAQSWYLAIDTQLYALAPLFLIPLLRWPTHTISIIGGLIFASAITAFCISWAYELESIYLLIFYSVGLAPVYTNFLLRASQQFNQLIYYSTHIRMGPWLLGNILGYFVFNERYKKFKLNKKIVWTCWTFSIFVMLVLIFGHSGFIDYPYNKITSSLFNSLARDAWSLSLCWVIFACASGYGGIANYFLSNRVFGFLARLNYSVFLLHLLVIFYQVAQSRTPGYFRLYDQFHNFCGDYFLTILLSIAWTVLFEMPFINLEKQLFPKKARIPRTSVRSITEVQI